jgi:glycosyltransferase involved in cell wall biosynthesis
MGVPVLATSNGGTAEIVRDGIDGLLLQPRRPELWADAAASLLLDPGRRLALGVSGRERARTAFSPQHHAAQIYGVYRNVHARGR